jgi:hypothetical protein
MTETTRYEESWLRTLAEGKPKRTRPYYAIDIENIVVHQFPSRAWRDAWLVDMRATYGMDAPVRRVLQSDATYWMRHYDATRRDHTI